MSAPIKQSHRDLLADILAPGPSVDHAIRSGDADEGPQTARALRLIAAFEESVRAEEGVA